MSKKIYQLSLNIFSQLWSHPKFSSQWLFSLLPKFFSLARVDFITPPNTYLHFTYKPWFNPKIPFSSVPVYLKFTCRALQSPSHFPWSFWLMLSFPKQPVSPLLILRPNHTTCFTVGVFKCSWADSYRQKLDVKRCIDNFLQLKSVLLLVFHFLLVAKQNKTYLILQI